MSLCACLSVLSLVWVSGCTPSGKGKLTTHEGPRKLQASTLKRGWTRELEEEEEEVTAKAVNGVGNRMLEQRRGRQGGVYILLDLATTGRVDHWCKQHHATPIVVTVAPVPGSPRA
jgi:hypothetical protein